MSLISEDADPSGSHAAARTAVASPAPNRVTFNRLELNRILKLYGRMVADGEWRDYAIDFRPGMAIFSIFRHTAEQPLFAIAKVPGTAQGGYMVYNGPRKLAHGESLEDVLRVFDRKLKLLLG